MHKTEYLVNFLLETDEAESDALTNPNAPPEEKQMALKQFMDVVSAVRDEGTVNYLNATQTKENGWPKYTTFWHKTATYSDGITPYEVRRNGKTQTWKTRPGEFRIPIKIGYKGYGNITNKNAEEFSIKPLPLKPGKPKGRQHR